MSNEYEITFSDGTAFKVLGRPKVTDNGDLIISGPLGPSYIYAASVWASVSLL